MWSRVRGVGAAAAVVVFIGTAALAPFSLTSAFADNAGTAAFDLRGAQRFTSVVATESAIDLSIAGGEVASASPSAESPSQALYSLEQFMFGGVVNWSGYRFTFYSQQVLPGSGLQIPGRHVNAGGFVSDSDGFIVLAGSAPKGTVYETPFGYPGKIYDRGTSGNHLDVYIR